MPERIAPDGDYNIWPAQRWNAVTPSPDYGQWPEQSGQSVSASDSPREFSCTAISGSRISVTDGTVFGTYVDAQLLSVASGDKVFFKITRSIANLVTDVELQAAADIPEEDPENGLTYIVMAFITAVTDTFPTVGQVRWGPIDFREGDASPYTLAWEFYSDGTTPADENPFTDSWSAGRGAVNTDGDPQDSRGCYWKGPRIFVKPAEDPGPDVLTIITGVDFGTSSTTSITMYRRTVYWFARVETKNTNGQTIAFGPEEIMVQFEAFFNKNDPYPATP